MTKSFREYLQSVEPLEEELKMVDGVWALVSKKTGTPLRYYRGVGKPSDDWVKSQERQIQFFKHNE